MSNQPQDVDPFAGGEKAPSLSFKDAPIGTTYTGTITATPKLVQARNYNTGEPDFWPAKPGETPNPKMAVVIELTVDGEPRTVWAVKPSAMFTAIGDAQKAAGERIAVGGTFAVRLTGEIPHPTKPNFNPIKQYAVKYTAPVPADVFADTAPAAPVATLAEPTLSDVPW